MTARSRFVSRGPLALAVLVALGLVTSVAGSATAGGYVRADLVSDLPGAARTDANLVNAWGIGFAPGVPEFRLNPDVVLLIVLPPLLYSAAFFSSLRELRTNLRSISLLSIGLVLATMGA